MTAEADVIRLVQRADWTRLSLAAEANDGSRVLLAPGRRYREQALDGVRGCDGERSYDDKMTVGPARLSPDDIGDLADASWLLECRISGGALIMAGDRPAYRLHAARGAIPSAFSMMFPAAVAVVDAELGIVLSLTSFLGGKPVRRYELRDVTAARADDFRVDIPSDLRVEPETNPGQQGVTPLNVAGAVAREVGKEAAKAARNFLRRPNP